jgi:hypothetical protein
MNVWKKLVIVYGSVSVALLLLIGVHTYTQTDAIREAAIRFHIHQFPQIRFVSINGKDPDDEFLSRFRDLKGLVRKGSQSLHDPQGQHKLGTYYVDRSTGEQGDPLSLFDITWQNPLKAQIKSNSSQNGLTLFLEKNLAGWRVVNYKQRWAA